MSVPFPPNHPVWDYPEGQRAAKVRDWVDIATKLEAELRRIRDELRLMREGLSGKRELPEEKPAEPTGYKVSKFLEGFDD